MPDACPRDPLETWIHLAAAWAVLCLAIGFLSGSLAARLEAAAGATRSLEEPFEAHLEKSYLALMLLGAFLLLNLAFTYWPPDSETGALGRASVIALVILGMIGFKGLCMGLARWRRRARLAALSEGHSNGETWAIR